MAGLLVELAVAAAGGRYLDDPAGADPGMNDMFWGLLSAQRPGDVTAVADLMIHCEERGVPLTMKMVLDLAVKCLLIGFDGQEEVSALLLVLRLLAHPERLKAISVAPPLYWNMNHLLMLTFASYGFSFTPHE